MNKHLSDNGQKVVVGMEKNLSFSKQSNELNRLSEHVIHSMAHHIAVIDLNGVIVGVNDAWTYYGEKNGASMAQSQLGMNYLAVCDRKTKDEIKKVLKGESERVKFEYPCHSPKEKRWFVMNVTPLYDTNRAHELIGATIVHLDITDRKLLEISKQKDIALARAIQQQVLVPEISNESISIEAIYMPSDQLSGDMYAWYQISDELYGVILIDIMGHGLSSSLISMAIRSLLEDIIVTIREPGDVYRELNRQFHSLFKASQGYKNFFCTGIYMIINTTTQEIDYFNSGHPSAVGVGQDRTYTFPSTVMPIGFQQSPEVGTGSISYNPGDQLILYTDGLIETFSLRLKAGEEFVRNEASKASAKGLKKHFQKLVSQSDQRDDIAIITIQL